VEQPASRASTILKTPINTVLQIRVAFVLSLLSGASDFGLKECLIPLGPAHVAGFQELAMHREGVGQRF